MAPEKAAPGYTLRPGGAADVRAAVHIYRASFDNDSLLDVLFPGRRAHPDQLDAWLHRHFSRRWWTPGYMLTVLDDAAGRTVGFTWWKRPVDELSWVDRWLTPYAWFAPLARFYYSLKDVIRPTPFHEDATGIFTRVFAAIEPQLLNSPRRRRAWYLSTIGILPSLQGHGLGGVLLRDGLRAIDTRGAASYLIAVRGIEPFYQRYGFVEVGRSNVGELQAWDGGAVMFRE